MLLHGDHDSGVNVRQSQNFFDKLKGLAKSVDYVEFENGDHHLSIQSNRHAAFNAMNNFLKQHLGSTY